MEFQDLTEKQKQEFAQILLEIATGVRRENKDYLDAMQKLNEDALKVENPSLN